MFSQSFRRFFGALLGSSGTAKPPRRPRRYHRPQCLCFEARLTPSTIAWTGANHAVDNNWSDSLNWAGGAVPGPGDTALFTSTGTQSFTANVDTPFALDGLTVDSSWGGTINVNQALTVANAFQLSSGTLNDNRSISLSGSASLWNGGQINLSSSGTFSNSGTLTADLTGANLVLSGSNVLTNHNTFNLQGGNSLLLENGVTLSNLSGAILDFLADGNLGQSGGGTLSNAGTVIKTGGTATSTISSTFNSTSGTIDSESGTLALASAGGVITSNSLIAGLGGSTKATVDLTGGTAVHYTGTFTGSGSGIITVGQGTLMVDSGGATFNCAGKLFQWGGNSIIDVSSGGTFTNTGTINISTTGTIHVNGPGNMINSGTINQSLAGNLDIQNGATLTNKKTFSIKADASILPGGIGSNTFVNTGTLQKTGGTGTSNVKTALNNTGTVLSKSGTLNIQGGITQISGTTLTAGKWNVTGTATVHPVLTLSSSFNTLGSKAKVTLTGPNVTSGLHPGQPVFTNLASLTTILAGGSLTLTGGVDLSTNGPLTNNGLLTTNAGDVLTVNGSFTEASTATWTVQLGGTSTAPSFGQVVSSGPISLAGKLVLKETSSTLKYTTGTQLQFLTNTGLPGSDTTNGTFASINLTVGQMTFSLSYGSGDGNDVTLTETA